MEPPETAIPFYVSTPTLGVPFELRLCRGHGGWYGLFYAMHPPDRQLSPVIVDIPPDMSAHEWFTAMLSAIQSLDPANA